MEQKAPNMADLLANHDQANKFFHDTPAEAWEAMGEKTALSVYCETQNAIKAYDDFVKSHNIDPSSIKSISDFKNLPLVDKYNYIQKYGFNEVNISQAGDHLYGFALSSGTTDEPTIWPRYFKYEEFLPSVCDNYFSLYWQINKKSTLVINAIALGPWNAGFTMHAALRPLTQKYNFTLSDNGADLESIIFTIKRLGQYYDQIVIFSYTTFARTILERLEQEDIDIRKLNLKLFVGGEGHTVEWSQYINKVLTGNKDSLTAIIDGYGTSEGGLLGMGSAMTTLIRGLANKNRALSNDLFGRTDSVPNMFQYVPSSFYIEELNCEVVFTSKGSTPLVRYNLHDRGGVLKFREVEEILKKHGYDYKKMIKEQGLPEEIVRQQPFVYCFGRRDDTVSVCAAKIFPEQIEPALFNEEVTDIHSFKLATAFDKKQRQYFYILLELKPGISYSKSEIVKKKKYYHDIILNRLLDCSIDFANAYQIDSRISNPNIEIYENGQGPFENDSRRTKPKLIFLD